MASGAVASNGNGNGALHVRLPWAIVASLMGVMGTMVVASYSGCRGTEAGVLSRVNSLEVAQAAELEWRRGHAQTADVLIREFREGIVDLKKRSDRLESGQDEIIALLHQYQNEVIRTRGERERP